MIELVLDFVPNEANNVALERRFSHIGGVVSGWRCEKLVEGFRGVVKDKSSYGPSQSSNNTIRHFRVD